jgi:hypothetical protein
MFVPDESFRATPYQRLPHRLRQPPGSFESG